MRIYTKEWYRLMQDIGVADLFEPVIDKEYTDEEFEQLYQDMMDKYIQEERDSYDEPPCMIIDEEDMDPEDFDPEDYIIGDIDEDGNEVNLRHPESYEEFMEYQKLELQRELEEYESRLPFDEEEAREEFIENYKDNLEEPDEDIADWVKESVDPRLLALWLLPESVYEKYMAEDKVRQDAFDEIDEKADEAYASMMESVPDEYEDLTDALEEVNGSYVLDLRKEGGNVELLVSGWDDDGDEVRQTVVFEDADVIEDEGVNIEVWTDEDGDTMSSCDIAAMEYYFEDGGIEIHMLFDCDEGDLRYFTLRCSDITIE